MSSLRLDVITPGLLALVAGLLPTVLLNFAAMFLSVRISAIARISGCDTERCDTRRAVQEVTRTDNVVRAAARIVFLSIHNTNTY